jgi:hypothetical protein
MTTHHHIDRSNTVSTWHSARSLSRLLGLIAGILIALGLGATEHTHAAAPGIALADQTYPMRFAVRTDPKPSNSSCADCVVVVGQGVIMKDSASQLASFLKRWSGNPGKATLRLHSPGGHLVGALHLGRAIRKAGFQTEALSARPCQSACAFAILGGTSIAAQSNGLIVHDMALSPQPIMQSGQRARSVAANAPIRAILTAALRSYLAEMGASALMLDLASTTPNDQARKLGTRDLAKLGISHIPH